MTIFNFINDILYKKSGTLLDKKETESEFQPFLIQRWLSMHSNSNVRLLNATTNKIYKALENKDSWYKLFIAMIPRSKFKKFRYIKKVSKDTSPKKADMEAAIEMVANSKQISKREVRMYVEEYGLDLNELKKRLKQSKE